jgi:hypothetical protein
MRLEREDSLAGGAFDAARQRLREKVGISPRGEYQSLLQGVDAAWQAVLLARQRLDSHIRAHRCIAGA